eukprot:5245073-Heterocapsa_arctica.AAC.1
MVVVPGNCGGSQDCSPHEGLTIVGGPACGLCSGLVVVRSMGIWGLHGRGLSDCGLEWELEPARGGQ